MPRRIKKKDEKTVEIPMTPMIDVVFQLLIYFIVTIKPIDVVAHLDVNRPSPDERAKPDTPPPKLLTIAIYANGYTLNEKQVTPASLEKLLEKLAALNKEQTVLIQATALSPHHRLVKVLNLCNKNGLKNLSVVSTN